VFEATIMGAEPESRESHLEFRWLPHDEVADTEIRPAAIKCAFSITTAEQRAVWRTWDD
jgi:hypothetical protein